MMRPIDADALKEWAEEYHASNWGIPQDELIYAIGSAPTIEPKKGKWETKPFIDPNDPMKDTGAVWCRCSECKNKLGVFQDGNFFDYCPKCGARMENNAEEIL